MSLIIINFAYKITILKMKRIYGLYWASVLSVASMFAGNTVFFDACASRAKASSLDSCFVCPTKEVCCDSLARDSVGGMNVSVDLINRLIRDIKERPAMCKPPKPMGAGRDRRVKE